MPKIINGYSGNESVAESLKSLGDSMFGDQAKQTLYREHANKAKRENTAAPLAAEAFRQNDPRELGAQFIMGDKPGADFNQYYRGGAAVAANGNVDDPKLATAMMSNGSVENTAPGQQRTLANARTINDQTTARMMAMEKYKFDHTFQHVLGEDGAVRLVPNSQAAGGQATTPPPIHEFTDENGDKFQTTWNAQTRRWERMAPQSPQPAPRFQPAPQAASGAQRVADGFQDVQAAQPAAQPTPGPRLPSETELMTIPPAPAGANNAAYRKAASAKVGAAVPALQDKALGALDFLTMSDRAKEIYKNSPEVFGPTVGTENYNRFVRAPAAALHLGDAQANMGRFNDVNSVTKELSSAGLKARYGARPTNIDLQQNNEMFGGLRSADSATAIRLMERMEKEHYSTIQHAIAAGAINPSAIPKDIAAKGVQLGIFDPRFFPHLGVTQPAQPAAPQAAPAPAQQGAAPAGPQSGPTPGEVQQGYQFLGGDPASPQSWKKVQ